MTGLNYFYDNEEAKIRPVSVRSKQVCTSVPSEYLFTRVLTREYLFFDTF